MTFSAPHKSEEGLWSHKRMRHSLRPRLVRQACVAAIVPREGFEPSTSSMSTRCSPTELTGLGAKPLHAANRALAGRYPHTEIYSPGVDR